MQPFISSRAAPLFTLPPWPALEVFLQVPETMPAQGTGGGERSTIGIANTPPSRAPTGLPAESRGRRLCPALLSLHWALPSLGLSALSSSGKTAWGQRFASTAESDLSQGVCTSLGCFISTWSQDFATTSFLRWWGTFTVSIGTDLPLCWMFIKGLAPQGSAPGAAKWCLNKAVSE